MVKLVDKSLFAYGRYAVIVAISTTLVACGGGSGDTDLDTGGIGGNTDTIVDNDFDNDGIDDLNDLDDDGDGLPDANGDDLFIDLNSDGRDDFSGAALGEAYAGDPRAQNLISVTQTAVCGSVQGSDAFSNNSDWADNCFVDRSNTAGGIFADSLYSVGVQRILFCAGFGTEGQNYDTFVDGEFGPGTATALQAFQASAPGVITDDGICGERYMG